MENKLTYNLIKKAVSGDILAVNNIVQLYIPYINTLITERLFDRKGNEYLGVNIELKECLIKNSLKLHFPLKLHK